MLLETAGLTILALAGLTTLALTGLTTLTTFFFPSSDLILGRSNFDLLPFFFLLFPSESESLLDFDLDFTLRFSVGV